MSTSENFGTRSICKNNIAVALYSRKANSNTLKPLMIDNDMGSPQTFDSAGLRGKENNAPEEQDLFTFSPKLDKTARIKFDKDFLTKDI